MNHIYLCSLVLFFSCSYILWYGVGCLDMLTSLAWLYYSNMVLRYLYTSVDVISEFFSYHVWLWWFLWWSVHLAIGLHHMFSTFYCRVLSRPTWFMCTFIIQWETVVHHQIPSAKVFFFFGSFGSCHQGGAIMTPSFLSVSVCPSPNHY